ncbi:MAG: 3-oxoadipate enol-lactonase [Solirubrobacteraceae bacterium]|jgi:3-oxoadipate enol-lactonase
MTAVDLHHELDGPDGAPVLMMAGSLGTTLAMWDPQRRALAGRVRTIAIDLRGHGGSPAPPGPYSLAELGGDAVALLDRLGLERVSWCGLSLGGMVGQWLAINAPDRIERLVLISTSAHLPPAQGWHERAAAVRAAGTPGSIADVVLARWFTAPYAQAHPDVIERFRTMIAASPAEGYAACCEAIADLDLRARLPGIAAPTLAIAGRQDPATPPEHLELIAGAVTGARLELLDPGAHLCSVERADEVSALIAGHLGLAR